MNFGVVDISPKEVNDFFIEYVETNVARLEKTELDAHALECIAEIKRVVARLKLRF
jgi:hypothetical protein